MRVCVCGKMNEWDNAKERKRARKTIEGKKNVENACIRARTAASQNDGTMYNYCVITNNKRDNGYDVDDCDDDHNDDDVVVDDDEDDHSRPRGKDHTAIIVMIMKAMRVDHDNGVCEADTRMMAHTMVCIVS